MSRLPSFFERIAKTDLLILDDAGIKRLNAGQVLDQMEIIEDRHGRQTTIIANQVPSQDGMRPFRATTRQLT